MRSVDVGARLRLVPYWERGITKSERIELIIDPGPSFGAGDHPTTIMALELLEIALGRIDEAVRFPTMLDVGTGTGVLAIAGKILGTGFTVGVDIDPAAAFSARRNVTLNRRDTPAAAEPSPSIQMVVGGLESIKGVFDMVAANLAAPTLLNLRDSLLAATGSFLILSGIADAMAEDVVRSYGSAGCFTVMRKRRGGWNAALLHRRGASRGN